MKKFILMVLLLLLLTFLSKIFFSSNNKKAILAENTPVVAPKPSIEQLITLNAEKYQVSEKTMQKVINCESKYNPNAIGDKGHSFGLVQIHLPSHPNVSKAQANDPEFAVSFLAENLSKGKGYLWTCWRNLK